MADSGGLKRKVIIALLIFSLAWQAHMKGKKKTKTPSKNELAVQKIIEMMEDADVNAAGPNDVLFNYQQRSGVGNAPGRFVKFIDKRYLKLPTVETLLTLAGMYQPQLGVPEKTNRTKEQMIERFLDLILQTKVMKLLKQFLRYTQTLATNSDNELKELLRELWFTAFSRREKANDTSAFEHYFVGELYKGKVSGLHNWIRFAVLEANDEIDYRGYVQERKHSVATLHFTWKNMTKPMSSFLLGASPEFDMAASTICSLLRPGIGQCEFFYKDCKVIYSTRISAQKGKSVLYTSFPTNGGSCRDARKPTSDKDRKSRRKKGRKHSRRARDLNKRQLDEW